jgi:epoxide hydrolase 4
MTQQAATNGSSAKQTESGPKLERRNDGFLHRVLDVGEVRLHVAEARPSSVGEGPVPEDVPLVVLLHGFPEFWRSWKHQLEALSAAGFWAVAPDMRGYNESEKPEGVGSYEVEKLGGDVAGLIRALGRKDAFVVGHDWGAVVAWAFAMEHPHLLKRLAILNVPHPIRMTQGLRRPKQLKKSWYMFFFQLPFGIPERFFAKNDYAWLRLTFKVDKFPTEEIEHYVDAMRVPGAVTSAMSYYRAALRRLVTNRLPKMRPIERPVLVLWGDRDRYLGKEMAEPPRGLVPDATVKHFPNATHWIQNDAPDEVNRELVAFFRAEP